MASSPLHPGHIPAFSSYIETRAGAGFAALGSLCPPGFTPHYVAVQPGRCRRFIGTLLARIKYAPRIALEDKDRRSESLAADQDCDLARNNFEIDRVEKIAMKVFEISIFAICNF